MGINVKGVWVGCKESLRGMLRDVEQVDGVKGKVKGDKNILIISSQIGLDGTLLPSHSHGLARIENSGSRTYSRV
jgi:hypothetical protein